MSELDVLKMDMQRKKLMKKNEMKKRDGGFKNVDAYR